MSAPRISAPEHLPGATNFSREPLLADPVALINLLKSTPQIWPALEQATTVDRNWGRKRLSGSWTLAYAAFVISGHIDVKPWYERTASDLWHAAGFAGAPSYQTVWARFGELEDFEDSVLEAASTLIQHARRREPRIGQHLHVDGTEAETNAAFVHDCTNEAPCMRRSFGRRGVARRPQRTHSAEARAERHRETDAPISQEPQAWELDPEEAIGEARPEAWPKIRRRNEKGEAVVLEYQRWLRVKLGEHWYRTRDKEAGWRMYTRARGANHFWHGYYNLKSIDHYTGAPVAVEVEAASVPEYKIFPALSERIDRALSTTPQTVVADRGFSQKTVFEALTASNVAAVIPWRASSGAGAKRHDHETHDRHGIPRCKHCGGPTDFVRFNHQPTPRLWTICLLGHTTACGKTQSIACSKDWRLLVPLWRTSATYHELRSSHQRYERVHHHWRERYGVGGDTHHTRPKRVSRAGQQLRATVAMMIEWLRICWREGWLSTPRRNTNQPQRQKDIGPRIAARFAKTRQTLGLLAPYGRSAAVLGVGPPDPPSRR